MSSIFLSYRRDDSAATSGRVYDRLAAHFGKRQVFKDIDSIPLGEDFARYIASVLEGCAVEVVIIGSRWLDMTDASGRRRLDDPQDFVRLEIEAALTHDLPIIPLLVDGARMPAEHELPPSLAALGRRNGLALDNGRHFDDDMRRLLTAIERYVASSRPRLLGALGVLRARPRRPMVSAPATRQSASLPAPAVPVIQPASPTAVPRPPHPRPGLKAGAIARSGMLAGMAALLLVIAAGGLLIASGKPFWQLFAWSAPTPTPSATLGPTATATATPTPSATPFATVPASWQGQAFPMVNTSAKYEIYVAPGWTLAQTSSQPFQGDGAYGFRDYYSPRTNPPEVNAQLTITQTETLNNESDILASTPGPDEISVQAGTRFIDGGTCQKQQIVLTTPRQALRFGCHHKGLGYYIYFACSNQAFDALDRDAVEPMLDTLHFTT